MDHQKRTYRNLVNRENLVCFRVVVKETDLYVHTESPLEEITKELILQYRGYIENFVRNNPGFAQTLVPWDLTGPAPSIIQAMAGAGEKAVVGPMAAVAGAIAEKVGMDLISYSKEVVVENGGDIFIKTDGSITVGIYAGRSPLSLRVGLRFEAVKRPFSVCTSSGTVGHSLSLGSADAVSVVSDSCALADAAATAIGNRIKTKKDISAAIEFGKQIEGVAGLVLIVEDKIGIWGDMEVVPLSGKKG
jgi:ApbE superfamily uncharacterized protein (UPF0280 family)